MMMIKCLVFSLLFLSVDTTGMNCCCKKKKPKKITIATATEMHRPVIVTPSTVVATPSAIRKPSIDQQELSARLLQAAEYGWPDQVKSAIELRADVHAQNSSDGKRAMYTAARLATEQYDAGDLTASANFVAVISELAKAGANQSEDLIDFLHKEPVKTAHQNLQKEEAKKEESDDDEEDEE